jgi:pyridoxal phosphate enzyme (YggS family)
MIDLEANLQTVQNKIAEVAGRVGRNPEDIRLVAITKTHPPGLVRAAYDLGLREFGENRVNEGVEKITKLNDLQAARWHMVGHVQSRKASDIPGHFQVVHSIDRHKIARHLDNHADQKGVKLTILLECNVSGEASKYGWE